MEKDDIRSVKEYWERHAQRDPLWAVLSDPAKKARKWKVREFFETGKKEVSILMYHLESLGIEVSRSKALDFGCGVGRLTQRLADHFGQVVGVDISETMIELADAFNRCPQRVRYVCNPQEHLKIFEDRQFSFIYSNIVLQHLHPDLTLKYLGEFMRILESGGLLIFQLPSHLRESETVRPAAAALNDDAYASLLRLEGIPPSSREPGAEISLTVMVKNASPGDWVRNDASSFRLGNHWLSGDGRTLLIQDDGRADLPPVLAAGEECLIRLTVRTPSREGDYRCEIDLVHEAVSWFKEKGAPTMSFGLRVESGTVPSPPSATPVESALRPDGCQDSIPLENFSGAREIETEDPGDFPMNGIPREQIVDFFESRGEAVIRIEEDEHSGREWTGYRYFIRKKSV